MYSEFKLLRAASYIEGLGMPLQARDLRWVALQEFSSRQSFDELFAGAMRRVFEGLETEAERQFVSDHLDVDHLYAHVQLDLRFPRRPGKRREAPAKKKLTPRAKKGGGGIPAAMLDDPGATFDVCANCGEVCGDHSVCGGMKHVVCRLCVRRAKKSGRGCPCCSGTFTNKVRF